MEYTTNLNLKKPDVNEYYNIEQNNENMDLIDEAVGELNSQVGTETLTTTAQNCTGAINELNKKFESYLTAYLSSNASLTKNVRTTIKLTQSAISSNDFTVLSDGKIQANVNCVVYVNVCAYIQSATSSYDANTFNIYIHKNNSQQTRSLATLYGKSSLYFTLSTNAIIPLYVGDTLSVEILSQTVDCTVASGGGQTYLNLVRIG